MTSANLVLRHGGRLFKYAKYDHMSPADRWVFTGRLSDVWAIPDADNDNALSVVSYERNNSALRFSQTVGNAFLFDLTSDPSEMFNLLHPQLPDFDEALNAEVIERCEDVLSAYMKANEDELISSPFEYLHERLPGRAISGKTDDGKFVRPFLDDKSYAYLIDFMLATEGRKRYIPRKLSQLYTKTWKVPTHKGSHAHSRAHSHSQQMFKRLQLAPENRTTNVWLGLALCAAVAVGMALCGRAVAGRTGKAAAAAGYR